MNKNEKNSEIKHDLNIYSDKYFDTKYWNEEISKINTIIDAIDFELYHCGMEDILKSLNLIKSLKHDTNELIMELFNLNKILNEEQEKIEKRKDILSDEIKSHKIELQETQMF